MNKDITLEDLGYEIDSTNEIKGHLYFYKDCTKIDFDLIRKNLYKYNLLNDCRCPILMEELQAIYNKCKNLGWLDD